MAVILNEIFGHEPQKQSLIQAWTKQALPHAMIFAGTAGIGKSKVALALAQMLICEKPTDQACGVCGSCLRVSKNQSEFLKNVVAETNQIKIDQIRDVLDFLSLSTNHKNRVIIIDQAQNLNPQAANSLLKTLEEPYENVFFILLTPDVRLLMATIRSRAQVINFNLLTAEDLKRIKPDLEDWIYTAARGSVFRMIALSNEALTEKRTTHLSFFESFWLNQDFLLSGSIKEHVKDRASALQILRDWLQFTRDVIYFKHDEKDLLINSDFRPTYRQLAHVQFDKLNQFAKALIQSEKEMDKVDLTLFFESLWVTYARN